MGEKWGVLVVSPPPPLSTLHDCGCCRDAQTGHVHTLGDATCAGGRGLSSHPGPATF